MSFEYLVVPGNTDVLREGWKDGKGTQQPARRHSHWSNQGQFGHPNNITDDIPLNKPEARGAILITKNAWISDKREFFLKIECYLLKGKKAEIRKMVIWHLSNKNTAKEHQWMLKPVSEVEWSSGYVYYLKVSIHKSLFIIKATQSSARELGRFDLNHVISYHHHWRHRLTLYGMHLMGCSEKTQHLFPKM